ncbi:hypothetical protein RHSIM_Rhsim10G0189600 [Rhododendron simsii]|uniref:Uncharacterized protein n=1 Tax=Rhododendron simsii TaxID=118357 RepID=A0A834GBB1_RHOSS|nr:hypothetical protein RHSIM_Rhsim10G0189600 [Rhododendron simsii]
MEVPTSPEVFNRPTAALSRSEFLTRQEVLKRRLRRRKRLAKVYGDHYWSMMENVKIKFREYYWVYGKSLFKEKSLLYMLTSARQTLVLVVACCDVIRILAIGSNQHSVGLEMLNLYCKNLHVINNSLEDGWGEFYDDNHLQQESKYGPMNANSDIIDNNAPSGEIMTAWLPSVFFADHYPLQFAYVEAPQTSVSQLFAVYFHPLLQEENIDNYCSHKTVNLGNSKNSG